MEAHVDYSNYTHDVYLPERMFCVLATPSNATIDVHQSAKEAPGVEQAGTEILRIAWDVRHAVSRAIAFQVNLSSSKFTRCCS